MEGSVRKRGNKWYYSFEAPRINGKRVRIERVGGSTKPEAQEALRNAIMEYEKSGSVIDETRMSVHDYLDYWLTDYVERNLKYNTQISYKNIIKNQIKPAIGSFYLKTIKPSALQKLIDDCFEKGLSKSTLVVIQTILSSSFKRAVYPYQFIKENPAQYITMPKYNKREETTKKDLKLLTIDQVKEIIDVTSTKSPLYIPMMIAFYTGLRIGEVSGLTWDNIDLANQELTVDKIIVRKEGKDVTGTPKTQSSYRTIDIGLELVSILKRHQIQQKENKLFYGQHYTDSNFLCTKENGKLVTPNSIRHYVHETREKTGIDFSFHSFRHTHASILMEGNVKYKEIQQRLGHSKVSTTIDTYSHLTKRSKKQTADLFDKLTK